MLYIYFRKRFLTIIEDIISIFRKVCKMYNLHLKIRNSLSFPIIIFNKLY